MKSKEIFKIIAQVIIAALTALMTCLGMQSCTASRVVSTSSSYVQHGDTTTTITTKTVESYTSKKNL